MVSQRGSGHDPCCGAGEALADLAARINRPDGATVETYGVELHAERAKEAQDRLDHVLGTDLFQTSIANGAFISSDRASYSVSESSGSVQSMPRTAPILFKSGSVESPS